jgi:hypothetical protein
VYCKIRSRKISLMYFCACTREFIQLRQKTRQRMFGLAIGWQHPPLIDDASREKRVPHFTSVWTDYPFLVGGGNIHLLVNVTWPLCHSFVVEISPHCGKSTFTLFAFPLHLSPAEAVVGTSPSGLTTPHFMPDNPYELRQDPRCPQSLRFNRSLL